MLSLTKAHHITFLFCGKSGEVEASDYCFEWRGGIHVAILFVNTNRFNEQVTGYDKMGNILGLKRYGQTSATGYDVIDDLSLSYVGNQLKKVADRSGTSAFNNGFEFKDGVDLSTEYEYDENGRPD